MSIETSTDNTIVILGLGTDLTGDDSAGLRCARALREYPFEGVRVLESSESGIALLDYITGVHAALILDAVADRRKKPGTIVHLKPAEFSGRRRSYPHFRGLPEMFELAERMHIPIPQRLAILAMVVDDPTFLNESLSPEIAQALPGYVARAIGIVQAWRHDSRGREAVPRRVRKPTQFTPSPPTD